MAPQEAHRLERARARKVMILTPVHRDTGWRYTHSLVETVSLFERYGIFYRTHFVVGNSNLPRARNELAAEFLATECTDALLIDADMAWTARDVLRLLASEQPLIGAVGRKRVDLPDENPEAWCVRFLPNVRETLNQDSMGGIEVRGVGTGFLKIERRVFEALIAAHPDWKRPGFESMSERVRAQYHRFFRFPDAEDSGEDYAFCEAWREIGGSVWMDPQIEIGHAGLKEFKGSIGALFQAAEKQEVA